MVVLLGRIETLDHLRDYVHELLARQECLERFAFPLTERVLRRGASVCGMLFCLHGPRSVKLTAVWETDGNRVLFYDSQGERFHQTELETRLTFAALPEHALN